MPPMMLPSQLQGGQPPSGPGGMPSGLLSMLSGGGAGMPSGMPSPTPSPTGMPPTSGPQAQQLMAMLAGMGLQNIMRELSKLIKTTTTIGVRGDKAERVPGMTGGQMGPTDAMAAAGINPQKFAQPPQVGATGGMNPLAALVGQMLMSKMSGGGGGGASGMGGPM